MEQARMTLPHCPGKLTELQLGRYKLVRDPAHNITCWLGTGKLRLIIKTYVIFISLTVGDGVAKRFPRDEEVLS